MVGNLHHRPRGWRVVDDPLPHLDDVAFAPRLRRGNARTDDAKQARLRGVHAKDQRVLSMVPEKSGR